MLDIEVLLRLNYKKGNVTTVFLHADIPENEKVYVEIPRGFEQFSKNGRKKISKLKNMLYGLCQSPSAF